MRVRVRVCARACVCASVRMRAHTLARAPLRRLHFSCDAQAHTHARTRAFTHGPHSKAAAALAAHLPEARVTLASRNADAAERAAAALRSGGARHVSSASADARDTSSVLRAIAGADLVINAAGPFQRAEQCNALEAAIASKVAYLDISDDAAYSRRAKQYAGAAEAAGVPCITAAGLYPGLSNLLAAHMQAEAEREALEDGASPEDAALAAVPERLRFSYWTAGSGGAGRTILATSLMLLGEDVEAYEEVRACVRA